MESTKENKLLKTGNFKRCKEDHSWLEYDKEITMICKTCIAQKGKIETMSRYNSIFINIITNYKPSQLKDHTQTECHKRTIRENNEKHIRALGFSFSMWKVVKTIPEDSAMKKCITKITINDHRALVKLFHIAYFIAQKGHTFTVMSRNKAAWSIIVP